MQPTGNSTSLSSGALLPPLPPRQRDPLSLSVTAGADVNYCLRYYGRVNSYNRWDDTAKLTNVVCFLQATAHTCFENNESEMSSSPAFSETMLCTFGESWSWARTYLSQLLTRSKVGGEAFISYIDHVMWLCRRAFPSMPEDEIVTPPMKCVAENALRHLVTKDRLTVNTFSEECR